MFGALFKRAQATIDTAVGTALNRLLIALPFVIGGGFAVAALAIWLVEELGLIWGLLAVSGLFTVIGLLEIPILFRRAVNATADAGDTGERTADSQTVEEKADPDTDLTQDAMLAAMKSLGPSLLPFVIRLVARNLPLIATIAAASFIMTRASNRPEDSGGEPSTADDVLSDPRRSHAA